MTANLAPTRRIVRVQEGSRMQCSMWYGPTHNQNGPPVATYRVVSNGKTNRYYCDGCVEAAAERLGCAIEATT